MPENSIGWSFSDPHPLGLITTFVYLLASVLSFWAASSAGRNKQTGESGKTRVFWIVLGIFLLLLGINKQLDLQALFMASVKEIAVSQGWYDVRRSVQLVFTIILAIILFLSFIMIIHSLTHNWSQYWLPITGTFILLVFIVVRAAGINKVITDTTSAYPQNPHRALSLFELSGTLVLSIGALQSLMRTRRHKRKSFKFNWEE